jgi:hypothetical protein
MLDGTFYALDAKTGNPLAEVATGGQSSGPAVSRGQIYLGTGDSAFPFLNPTLPLGGGSIVALGLVGGAGAGSGQRADLSTALPTSSAHAIPFRAEATGSITSATPAGPGLLLAFATSGNALHLGQYTSTGFALRTGDTAVGTETFSATNGDRFIKSFTGRFAADGTFSGTFTLGGGTGRFEGISGSGEFTTVFDADGVNFDLVIAGEVFYPDHGKR